MRHYATSWKVAGSIPDGDIGGLFIDIILLAHYGVGLTLPLTEMSTRNISWRVKAASAYG